MEMLGIKVGQLDSNTYMYIVILRCKLAAKMEIQLPVNKLLTEVNQKSPISFPLVLRHCHNTGYIIFLLAVFFL